MYEWTDKITVILNGKYSRKSTSANKLWKKMQISVYSLLLYSKMKNFEIFLSFCQKISWETIEKKKK